MLKLLVISYFAFGLVIVIVTKVTVKYFNNTE